MFDYGSDQSCSGLFPVLRVSHPAKGDFRDIAAHAKSTQIAGTNEAPSAQLVGNAGNAGHGGEEVRTAPRFPAPMQCGWLGVKHGGAANDPVATGVAQQCDVPKMNRHLAVEDQASRIAAELADSRRDGSRSDVHGAGCGDVTSFAANPDVDR